MGAKGKIIDYHLVVNQKHLFYAPAIDSNTQIHNRFQLNSNNEATQSTHPNQKKDSRGNVETNYQTASDLNNSMKSDDIIPAFSTSARLNFFFAVAVSAILK